MMRLATLALALLLAAPAAADCIDINTASLEELTALPLVGAARAEEIVDGRPRRFVPDLRKLHGICPARLYGIRTDGRACRVGD